MKTPKPLPLGPWPRGINTVASEHGPEFRPRSQPQDPPPALRDAVNLDLRSDGTLRRRVGRTLRLALTDGHSGVSIGGMLLLVDDGDLLRVREDLSTEVLASGLGSHPVSYELFQGRVWWANAVARGCLVEGRPVPWGITPPAPPRLVAVPGPLPAGRYRVTVTVEHAQVPESGALAPAEIDLPQGGAIRLEGIATQAPYLNVYASGPDLPDLFFVRRVGMQWVDSFTLTEVDVSTDRCQALGLYPPPDGLRHLCAHGGFLLGAVGPVLYWSRPLEPHKWRLATDFQPFADDIDLIASMPDGFFVRAGALTYWIAGNDPGEGQPVTKDDRPGAEGVLRLPGRLFPALQADGLVTVWASADGPVAGLPGGRLVHLTDGRVAMDTHAQAALTYRREEGIAQLLMSLKDRTATSRYGATDVATCEIVRGACFNPRP